MANLRLPGRSALTVAPPLSTTNICARTKRARQRPVARLPTPTFHVLYPAWAQRADRRPNRCAVTGAPVPTSPRSCKPGDGQTPFSNPRAATGSLLPDSFPSRIFRWLHHIHPIHRHHTAPTHLQNPSHPSSSSLLSRPVEHCEGCPPLAGARNRGLDDPRAVRPDSHCNFGDRSIRACRATAATQRKSRKRAVPAPRHCSAPTSRPGQSR